MFYGHVTRTPTYLLFFFEKKATFSLRTLAERKYLAHFLLTFFSIDAFFFFSFLLYLFADRTSITRGRRFPDEASCILYLFFFFSSLSTGGQFLVSVINEHITLWVINIRLNFSV